MLTSGYGPRAASGFENDAPRGEPADPFLPADVGRLRTSGDFPGRRAPVTTLRSWAPQRPALGLLPFFAVLFLRSEERRVGKECRWWRRGDPHSDRESSV